MNCKVTRRKRSKVVSVFVFVVIYVVIPCECQSDLSLPISEDSFSKISRATEDAPPGRTASYSDIIIRFYGSSDSTDPTSSYYLQAAEQLMTDPCFDHNKPTVFYAHGYLELITDTSVRTVVNAYHQNGGHNVVVLDWSNLAFGNYLIVAERIPTVGKVTAAAVLRWISLSLPVDSIHLVGHSLGAHVVGHVARNLKANGCTARRLSGLDPAYPAFYPPLFGEPISASDASFVDVIHSDSGRYGTPNHTGHADFWPNEGCAKQPGCPIVALPLTNADFCNHKRSWQFWAESVTGGEFLARRCDGYDILLRRRCEGPLVYMGLRATSDLYGDFYLRTAAQEPFALGAAGAY